MALAQYLQVWDMAHDTQLSPTTLDKLQWKLTDDQRFSVRSAYGLFFMANVRFACNKPIWKSKAPSRCKFFMWLVVHQRCLTADNLIRRGWPSNDCCPLCMTEQECCTHLFVHCRYTQHLWRCFKRFTGDNFITPDASHGSTEDWWLKARSRVPKLVRRNFDTVIILIH